MRVCLIELVFEDLIISMGYYYFAKYIVFLRIWEENVFSLIE